MDVQWDTVYPASNTGEAKLKDVLQEARVYLNDADERTVFFAFLVVEFHVYSGKQDDAAIKFMTQINKDCQREAPDSEILAFPPDIIVFGIFYWTCYLVRVSSLAVFLATCSMLTSYLRIHN